MTKVLVVVYSYTGTGRRLAQVLCAQQGWPLSEVIELRSRKKGMRGTWRCVLDSMLGRRPRVFCDGAAPERYEAVVLIAPIWIGRMAGPMRSFVAMHKPALRNTALITVMGSRGAAVAAAEFTRLTGHDPMLQTAVTTREVDDGSFAARLQAFGTTFKAALEPSSPLRPTFLSPQAA